MSRVEEDIDCLDEGDNISVTIYLTDTIEGDETPKEAGEQLTQGGNTV